MASMNTPACTTGKSSWRSAVTMRRPTPGIANTVSVMMAPPSSAPDGAVDADRQRDDEGQAHGQHGQGERGGHALHDQAEGGRPVEEGVAEVAPDRARDEAAELQEQGIVQAERRPQYHAVGLGRL